MDNKKVSVKDIARLANVSIATVSRVLNKNGRYSAETEQRVLDIVKQYGYTPNASAKSLRTNRSQSIGVIVPDITNEFFAKIVRSIENSILPYNYSVFICDSHEDARLENQHLANLIAKNVDGVIYISGKSDVAAQDEENDLPVVYIDRMPEHAYATVQSDNEYGGYLATEELLRKGCKRIVLLSDMRPLSSVSQRTMGYVKAHGKYGVKIIDDLKADGGASYHIAKQKTAELVEKGVAFDGIFATNDMMALGALHALLEHKIEVPGQVKLVGFDDISLSGFCEVPITTITQNTERIGERAVKVLMKLMLSEANDAQHYVVPVSLNVRKST